MRRKLCTGPRWIHRLCSPMHDIFMKRIFHERLAVGVIVNTRRIRFVLSKERRRFTFVGELVLAEHVVPGPHNAIALQRD